ncbi:hypothetical protein FGO68_gene686 [Halteria grandinella]|uniref:AAA+ ATPase domain-containing protein n=1 Tax=Halteria grandinella TaxID=5974 RepID=A0A8J8TAR8_HALGN|nr:hypothetical protein FGO68_gene686 [Halteria grandinella]
MMLNCIVRPEQQKNNIIIKMENIQEAIETTQAQFEYLVRPLCFRYKLQHSPAQLGGDSQEQRSPDFHRVDVQLSKECISVEKDENGSSIVKYLYRIRDIKKAINDDIQSGGQGQLVQITDKTQLKYFDSGAWAPLKQEDIFIFSDQTYTEQENLKSYKRQKFEPPYLIDVLVLNPPLTGLASNFSAPINPELREILDSSKLRPQFSQAVNRYAQDKFNMNMSKIDEEDSVSPSINTAQVLTQLEDLRDGEHRVTIGSTLKDSVEGTIKPQLSSNQAKNPLRPQFSQNQLEQQFSNGITLIGSSSSQPKTPEQLLQQYLRQHFEKNKLDMAFIHADPLLYRNEKNDQIEETKAPPLQVIQEFENLTRSLAVCHRQFRLERIFGTSDNVLLAYNQQPLIMHFSCHGTEIKGKYCLCFDSAKEPCIMDFYIERRVVSLMKDNNANKILIVFISACQSEKIGKIFKKYGAPVVIAINKDSTIKDEACLKFSQSFYNKLLNGGTPKEAFNAGITMITTSQMNTNNCCCSHDHLRSCKWDKKLVEDQTLTREQQFIREKKFKTDQHSYHQFSQANGLQKACTCETINSFLHKKNCEYAKFFIEKFIADEFKANPKKWMEGVLQVRICCCRPDLPHNEVSKFMLIERDPYKEEPGEKKKTPEEIKIEEEKIEKMNADDQVVLNCNIFDSREKDQGGHLVKVETSKLVRLKPDFQQDSIFMRKFLVKFIVEFIAAKNSGLPDTNIINIYGEKGLGKGDIVSYAARYALYNANDFKSVIFVDASRTQSVKSLKERMAQQMDQNGKEIIDILKNFDENEHALFILDKLSNLLEKEQDQFNSFIQEIMTQFSYKVKMIFITESEYKCDYYDKIETKEIKQLSPQEAVMYIAQKGGFDTQGLKEYCSKYTDKECIEMLENHELINKPWGFQRSPRDLKGFIELLKEYAIKKIKAIKLDLSKGLCDPNELVKWNFERLISLQPITHHQVQYDLLYILCVNPSGILDNALEGLASFLKGSSDESVDITFLEEEKSIPPWKEFLNALIQTSDNGSQKAGATYDFVKINQVYGSNNQYLINSPSKAKILMQLLANHELMKPRVTRLFKISLAFITAQSRDILDWWYSQQVSSDIELRTVSASSGQGDNWRSYVKRTEEFAQIIEMRLNPFNRVFPRSQNQLQLIATLTKLEKPVSTLSQIYFLHPNEAFKAYQDSFEYILSVDNLKEVLISEDLQEPILFDLLEELGITVISFLIDNNMPTQAEQYLLKCKQVAEHYKMVSLERKLIILRVALKLGGGRLENRITVEELEKLIKDLEQLEQSVNYQEETQVQNEQLKGDVAFLKALLYHRLLELKGDSKGEQIPPSSQAIDSINSASLVSNYSSQISLESMLSLPVIVTRDMYNQQLTIAKVVFEQHQLLFSLFKVHFIEWNAIQSDIRKLGMKYTRDEVQACFEQILNIAKEGGFKYYEARIMYEQGLYMYSQFEELRQLSLQKIGCIEHNGELRKLLYLTFQLLDQAAKICDELKIVSFKDTENLNRLEEYMKKYTQNMIYFALANPLVEVKIDPFNSTSSSAFAIQEVMVRDSSLYQRCLEDTKRSLKQIQCTQLILTEDSLLQMLTTGCKILLIQSQNLGQGLLQGEDGPTGRERTILVNSIKERYLSQSRIQASVDLLILAFPNSGSFVEQFAIIGIPNIIYFDKEGLEQDLIEQWCHQLIKKVSFTNDSLKDIIQDLENASESEDIGEVALKPKYYSKDENYKVLIEGDILLQHTSSKRDKGKVIQMQEQEPDFAIGMSSTMYQLYELLERDDERIITISGPSGIGKSSLVKEFNYYYRFTRGQFKSKDARQLLLIDLREELTANDVQNRIVEIGMRVDDSKMSQPPILIIDSLDTYPQELHNILSLFYLRENMTIIFVTRKELTISSDIFLLKLNVYDLPVRPLSIAQSLIFVHKMMAQLRKRDGEAFEGDIQELVRKYIKNFYGVPQKLFNLSRHMYQQEKVGKLVELEYLFAIGDDEADSSGYSLLEYASFYHKEYGMKDEEVKQPSTARRSTLIFRNPAQMHLQSPIMPTMQPLSISSLGKSKSTKESFNMLQKYGHSQQASGPTEGKISVLNQQLGNFDTQSFSSTSSNKFKRNIANVKVKEEVAKQVPITEESKE